MRIESNPVLGYGQSGRENESEERMLGNNNPIVPAARNDFFINNFYASRDF